MSWGLRRRWSRTRVLACAALLAAGGAAVPAGALGGSGPSLSEPLPGADRLPNGWALDPAGTQVLTTRATTGVWMSPSGSDIYATTSGIFDEAVVHVDGSSLAPTPTLVSDTFQGVAADPAGDVWVSGGSADRVWQFKAAGPALVDTRQAGAVPDTPNNGIAVTGYPGNMLLEGSKLFVAGNVSVPSATAAKVDGGVPCAHSPICSVVNVVDVSDPSASSPTVHAIPVGRDAYGLAYRAASSTLYVTNWADQTNPARSGCTSPECPGTVSVVHVNSDGTGSETQVVPVGLEPTGITLSPDGSTLVVTNAGSDTISVLKVDARTGGVAVTETLPVLGGAPPDLPLGASPVAAAFSSDGSQVFVALSGIDAVEVFSADGGTVSPVPQTLPGATFDGQTVKNLNVGGTFIPTGWYPDAMAFGRSPSGASRLVVANLRGGGAGPGYYGQTEPLVGSSTEGSLSVIDLPAPTSAQWGTWTRQVVEGDLLAPLWAHKLNDPASDPCQPAPLPDGSSVLSGVICGVAQNKIDPSTLHVVIIEAENKTFDSYFGDTGAVLHNANADPQWTEYGDAVTANQHNLAETYNVDDNFWNEGAESSTLGHSWLSGAYTTLDRELTWGPDYSQNLRGQRSNGQYAAGTPRSLSGPTNTDVNAQESVMLNPRQLLIDEVAAKPDMSVRLFGTDTRPGSTAVADGDQVDQALWGEGGSDVSTDLAWPDVDRAAIFLHGSTISHAWDVLESGTPPAQFGTTIGFKTDKDKQMFTLDGWDAAYKSCVSSGKTDDSCQPSMPNLVYMQLPENHTYDISNVFNPQDPTPQSMVADNDYAIGEIVQGLSQSPFWSHTLVMITEDDNQFTGDHVDIHRTFLLTAGGIARPLGSQGLVADQVGSFASVDRTAEALLGLQPMTLFDARAVPLQQIVADKLGTNTATYTAVYPPTPFLSGRVPGH